jgi:hypothetical protein
VERPTCATAGPAGRRHTPGVSLIVIGAIGMLAGRIAHNGDILAIGAVVTTIELVIYFF